MSQKKPLKQTLVTASHKKQGQNNRLSTESRAITESTEKLSIRQNFAPTNNTNTDGRDKAKK